MQNLSTLAVSLIEIDTFPSSFPHDIRTDKMNVKSEVKPEEEDVKIPPPPVDADDGSFDLDTAGLENRVWLVRLPKFLVDKWSHLDEHTNKRLGQVLIKENTAPGEKQKVSLRLSDTPENSEIPHEYELDIVKEVVNNTFVFTEKEQKKERKKKRRRPAVVEPARRRRQRHRQQERSQSHQHFHLHEQSPRKRRWPAE